MVQFNLKCMGLLYQSVKFNLNELIVQFNLKPMVRFISEVKFNLHGLISKQDSIDIEMQGSVHKVFKTYV